MRSRPTTIIMSSSLITVTNINWLINYLVTLLIIMRNCSIIIRTIKRLGRHHYLRNCLFHANSLLSRSICCSLWCCCC